MAPHYRYGSTQEEPRPAGSAKRALAFASGAAAVALCTLGVASFGGGDGGGRAAALLQRESLPRAAASAARWEREVGEWERGAEGMMLYGAFDGVGKSTDMVGGGKAAGNGGDRSIVSAALSKRTAAAAARRGRGKSQMLWNAAAGDEITAANVGRPHPSDALSFLHPRQGGVGHVLTEEEMLKNHEKMGAQVTDRRHMDYHPMKWLRTQAEDKARTMSLAQTDGWRAERDGAGKKYWWNIRSGQTQWGSPKYDAVRRAQSSLLAVDNRGLVSELGALRSMAK